MIRIVVINGRKYEVLQLNRGYGEEEDIRLIAGSFLNRIRKEDGVAEITRSNPCARVRMTCYYAAPWRHDILVRPAGEDVPPLVFPGNQEWVSTMFGLRS